MEQISGFPKNLAYNLKRLSGSVIKSKILLSSDKSEYAPNERIMFNFPIGRMIDTRSIVLTAKCETLTNGNYFPRGGLNSLIENLQITANSRVIQSTQNYNYIWNMLADISGYFSPEQASKRIYENFDPSITHTNVNGEGVIATSIATTTTASTSSYYFCVNNWLGFLSSSAPTLNTNDLGQIQLVITLAPNSCLWLAATNAPGTGASVGNYKVSDIQLSMDTITFTNSLYYDLVKEKLSAEGLNIAYNDYLVSVGSSVAKSTSGITHVAQFATNSLDAVYATFRTALWNTANVLVLGNATIAETASTMGGSSTSYPEIMGNPLSNEGSHGGYNNSRYFIRSGAGISASSWYINSQPFTINSSPIQIFNNTLQTLDYANLDIASGGLHAGAITTGVYNRYYFVDALSLENLSGDNNNWVSGLGGNGGVIQIQYNARFSTTDSVFPIIIGKVSKIMNVKIGRNIDIME
jgi:hypothetical protein